MLLNYAAFFALVSITACQNNPSPSTAQEITNTIPSTNNTIVGLWHWAGSANDENKNGVADQNEWKYKNATKEKEFAAMNISLEDLNLNFKTDGTGYTGKVENADNKFTWAANTNNTQITTQNVSDKSKSEFYFDKQGNLIQKDTGAMMAAGQKMHQTTFEMFKK